jgi:hypothetical protein
MTTAPLVILRDGASIMFEAGACPGADQAVAAIAAGAAGAVRFLDAWVLSPLPVQIAVAGRLDGAVVDGYHRVDGGSHRITVSGGEPAAVLRRLSHEVVHAAIIAAAGSGPRAGRAAVLGCLHEALADRFAPWLAQRAGIDAAWPEPAPLAPLRASGRAAVAAAFGAACAAGAGLPGAGRAASLAACDLLESCGYDIGRALAAGGCDPVSRALDGLPESERRIAARIVGPFAEAAAAVPADPAPADLAAAISRFCAPDEMARLCDDIAELACEIVAAWGPPASEAERRVRAEMDDAVAARRAACGSGDQPVLET